MRFNLRNREGRIGLSAVIVLASSASALLATTPSQALGATNTQFHGKIVISINSNGVGPSAGFKALAAAYKKVEPGVTLEWQPGPANGNYQTWLGTQLAVSNPTPDIVSGNYQGLYTHYVNLAQYRFQTNPYTGKPWNDAYNWNFFPSYNAQGAYYMIPTQAVHIEWFYNKDIFHQLHLAPPKTWNQLVHDAAVIKKAGIIPITAQYNIKVAQWMYEVYNYQYNFSRVNIVRAKPGDWDYNPEIAKNFKYSANNANLTTEMTVNPLRFYQAVEKGKIKFNTPQTADMVKNFAEIFPRYAQPDFFVSSWNDDLPLFMQQKAAMMIDGTWDLTTVAQDMKSLKVQGATKGKKIGIKSFNWGTFQDPSMTGPLVQAPAQSIESASGEYLSAINKNQYQSNMDMNFLQFWISNKGYQAWVNGEERVGQFDPAGPVEVHGVKLPATVQKLINSIHMQGNAEDGFTGDDAVGGVQDLQQKGYLDLENTFSGKTTPQQFANELQSLWMDNFNTILQQNQLTRQDLVDPARAPSS